MKAPSPPPKPKIMTPQQYHHYLRHLRKQHFTVGQRKRFDAKKRRKLARQRRQLAHQHHKVGAALAGAVAGEWILGGNDRLHDCAAVAVANSLLACTGRRAADREILALHAAAGGTEAGAAIPDVLDAALLTFLAGGILAGYHPADLDGELSGPSVIAELAFSRWRGLGTRRHAAVLDGEAIIAWGQRTEVTPWFLARHVTAAWRLEWQ